MKRTRPVLLIAVAILGAVVGFGLDMLLTSRMQGTLIPDVTLPIVLIVLAVACLVVAWPVRRAREPGGRPVNPFRAVRIAILAQASSILGAAAGGFSLGLLGFALSRPVMPPLGSVAVVGITVGASILLVVCALIAESFCTLPKDDDDDSRPDEPGAAAVG